VRVSRNLEEVLHDLCFSFRHQQVGLPHRHQPRRQRGAHVADLRDVVKISYPHARGRGGYAIVQEREGARVLPGYLWPGAPAAADRRANSLVLRVHFVEILAGHQPRQEAARRWNFGKFW
jgi:hypothetical protein